MKVWMIVLRGQGDTDVRVVDEATFRWVTSEDPGRAMDEARAGEWADQLVPEIQRKLKRACGEDEEVRLTSGSWWNDRMLQANSLPGYEGEAMYTLGDALRIIKRRGDEVEDTVEGEIY